jgi:type IV secretory pathway VirJ component
LQRKLNFPEFRVPVRASIGPDGGALIYVLLSEAPSYSFAGGASVDFAPPPGNAGALPKLKFCGDFKVTDGIYEPHDLKLPWQIEPLPAAKAAVSDWVDSVDKAEIVEADPAQPVADRLAALAQPLVDAALKKDPNSLDDLPLIEMPQAKPAPYVAIVYSGDGGWRDLDRTLGQILSASGVPVVGVDSLLYFWKPKRPEVVAHDLDRIMDHYATAWKTKKFVLIGFSFGADIMPFAYNRLSVENRARVAEIALLGVSHNAGFEISAEGYFSDTATDETRPIEPELMQIAPMLVQCFYGEDEADDSACNSNAGARFEVIKTAGGHHFGDDYDALAKRIMAGADKRLSLTPPQKVTAGAP